MAARASWWLRGDRLLPVLAVASLLVVVVRVRLEMGVLDTRESARTGGDALGWLGRRRAARRARAAGVLDERAMHRLISAAGVADDGLPAYRPRADHDASEANELVRPVALSRRALARFLECAAEHSDDFCRELMERERREANETAARAADKKADPRAHWLEKCDRRCQPACMAQCKQRRTDMYEAQLLRETGTGMAAFCTGQCANLCLQKCQKIAREALVPLG